MLSSGGGEVTFDSVCKKRDMTHRRVCYMVHGELYKTVDKI